MTQQFEGDDRPPPNWRRLTEAAWLAPRLWHTLRAPRTLGPADGPVALVIPGWVASDRTTLALRSALAEAGWRVHGWDLGFNWGAKADTLERLKRRLVDLVAGDPLIEAPDIVLLGVAGKWRA